MAFDLSEVAQDALAADETVLVLGGPGSGKTTLSLLKAQNLICGLESGQEVLFLSFSRAAVRQVEIRCKDVLSGDDRKRIAVRTYHSFAMEVLRSHGRLLVGKAPTVIYPGAESLMKADFDGEWSVESKRLAQDEGLFVFDEFAAGAANLVGSSSAVARLVANKYPIIILDEFQDTDDSQWALVQALAERSRLIFLADPDQHIFDYDPRFNPERLDHLRTALRPAEFDLGGENHRSPDAGILGYANAVLRNLPLPQTDDVATINYYPNGFDSSVHAAVVWMFSRLRADGIPHPSVVVLARTNALIGRISTILGVQHMFNDRVLRAVNHDVLWDAELTCAAALVVASILEWPVLGKRDGVAGTLRRVADYFDAKNAVKTNKSARSASVKFRTAAARVAENLDPRPASAQALLAAFDNFVLTGSPKRDWIIARSLLDRKNDLSTLNSDAKFVRLFGATDEIGGRLTELWDKNSDYRNAADVVRRALDAGKLQSDQREPRGCVLMNMHKAKGKEFDGVVIVEGLHSGEFYDPSRESPPFASTRRLLRVAITRARHRVAIVRPRGATPLVSSAAAASEVAVA